MSKLNRPFQAANLRNIADKQDFYYNLMVLMVEYNYCTLLKLNSNIILIAVTSLDYIEKICFCSHLCNFRQVKSDNKLFLNGKQGKFQFIDFVISVSKIFIIQVKNKKKHIILLTMMKCV